MRTIRKRLSVSLAIVSVLLVAVAHASIDLSPLVKVTRVYVAADPNGSSAGTVYIVFDSNPTFEVAGTPDCSNYNTGYWVIGGNADTVQAVQTAALSAKLSGISVYAHWNNSYSASESCDGGGHIGYPILRGLEF